MKKNNKSPSGGWYDPHPLLAMRDLDGEEPRIYIVDGNRTSGKTTGHYALAYEEWVTQGKQFACCFRWSGDVSGADVVIFDYIRNIYPNVETVAEPVGKNMLKISATKDLSKTPSNVLHETDEELDVYPCCYAISVNGSEKVRRNRAMLSDVWTIIFDEFLPEDGRYCPNELTKYQSIYLTIAGANRPSPTELRNVHLILISNHTNLSNPYYMSLGITKRYQDGTKWMRGNAWVWHRDDNTDAAQAIAQDPVMAAFGTGYNDYSAGTSYLTDTSAGVEKLSGRMRYICTITLDRGFKMKAGVYYHFDTGYLYVSSKIDPGCKNIIAPPGEAYSDDVTSTKERTKTYLVLYDAEITGKIRYESLEEKSILYLLFGKKLGE